jgi:hypothetical protein
MHAPIILHVESVWLYLLLTTLFAGAPALQGCGLNKAGGSRAVTLKLGY